MKDIITSREELLLAKIAGRDVDLSTMTPPVASNLTEQLLLDIADRIDKLEGGGSGASNDYPVTITSHEGGTFTADKTVTDILTAAEEGKNVYSLIWYESDLLKVPLVSQMEGDSVGFGAVFQALAAEHSMVVLAIRGAISPIGEGGDDRWTTASSWIENNVGN